MDEPTPHELSQEERTRIRLVEEYRYAVRQEIEKRSAGGSVLSAMTLAEKLLFPAAVVVISALVSGLVIPWVLDQQARKTRGYATRQQLIQDLNTHASRMLVAFRACERGIEDYWEEGVLKLQGRYLRNFLKRQTKRMTESDFKARDESLENDKEKITEAYFKAWDAFEKEHDSFRVWLATARSKLALRYEVAHAFEEPIEALAQGVQQNVLLLQAQEGYFEAVNDAVGQRFGEISRQVRAREFSGEEAEAALEDLLGKPPREISGEAPPELDLASMEEAVATLERLMYDLSPRVD